MLSNILWINSGAWWTDLFIAIVGFSGVVGFLWFYFQWMIGMLKQIREEENKKQNE